MVFRKVAWLAIIARSMVVYAEPLPVSLAERVCNTRGNLLSNEPRAYDVVLNAERLAKMPTNQNWIKFRNRLCNGGLRMETVGYNDLLGLLTWSKLHSGGSGLRKHEDDELINYLFRIYSKLDDRGQKLIIAALKNVATDKMPKYNSLCSQELGKQCLVLKAQAPWILTNSERDEILKHGQDSYSQVLVLKADSVQLQSYIQKFLNEKNYRNVERMTQVLVSVGGESVSRALLLKVNAPIYLCQSAKVVHIRVALIDGLSQLFPADTMFYESAIRAGFYGTYWNLPAEDKRKFRAFPVHDDVKKYVKNLDAHIRSRYHVVPVDTIEANPIMGIYQPKLNPEVSNAYRQWCPVLE